MTMYPDVQRKAQAEIDQIVGNSRLPNFSDEGALPYVQAVLKEALRWHPVTPLGGFLCVIGILFLTTGLFLQPCHIESQSATPTKVIISLKVQPSYRTRGAFCREHPLHVSLNDF